MSGTGRYRTIVADPPWQVQRTMGAGGRRANPTEIPYEMMSDEAIMALDVDALAADDCILFLWTTRARFRRGIAVAVAEAWGFEDCGEIVWGLRNPGTGSASIANDHEPCLIARRGANLLTAAEPLGVWFWKQVYEWNPKARVPQKRHSAKPPGFIELVEQIAPSPRLELFAREQRLGWDTWGNEALEHVTLGAAGAVDE
jgi:N6-adenosine-specific RNA methylase IME4